jgi:predicted Rossmann fold nucleotide-binding protein DprA/Smf involved in DNA uptake
VKLGIIGSRLFDDYGFVRSKILENFNVDDISAVVSGGAKGVDTLGERFADEFDLEKDITKPDWKKHGKGAAFIRNQEIVDNADELIAFPIRESGGTWDTIRKAHKAGKRVVIYEVVSSQNIPRALN